MPRLAIIGMGKMGRAVEQLARERGFEVVAKLGKGDAITAESLKGAEVAVEFTSPRSAPANAKAAIQAGCPIVVGTTGWYESRADVDALVKATGGALLVAPNFSPGIAAFGEIVKAAARILKTMPGYDAHIIETHHAAKQDAPSGTAKSLEATAAALWGANIPVTSVRVGSVPGTHEVLFDAPFEQIRLVHSARDRRVFAEGALHAARWLIGRTGV
ncbi:MAG TPA: dihydrodipicolinate reductase C-terminal domain-containing protein, partial [Gemmatimonadaceae bacterium]